MSGKLITVSSQFNQLLAYETMPEKDIKGGIIIIHEIWGLNDHVKDVANRFSAEGYVALAPDLLSGTAMEGVFTPELIGRVQSTENREQAQKEMQDKLAPMNSTEFKQESVAKLKSCFNQLINNPETHAKVAVIGFCFGGTYTFALAVAEPRLKLALPFYGHADHSVDELKNIDCPVMAFYGEQDSGLIEQLPELTTKMKTAGVNFKYKIYPETGHAFFNDTSPNRYNQAAATDAWAIVLNLLNETM